MILTPEDHTQHLDFSSMASHYSLYHSPLERTRTRTHTIAEHSRPAHLPSRIEGFKQEIIETPISQVKQKEHPLMRSFRKYRVGRLVRVFSEKLKRNVVLNTPVTTEAEFSESTSILERLFGEKEGLDLNNFWVVVLESVSLFIVTWLMIIYSLVLVFRTVQETDLFRVSQYVALIFYTLEITLNFFIKRYDEGKAINQIRSIVLNYLNRKFFIDMAFLALLIIDISDRNQEEICYLRMVIVIRFLNTLPKLNTLETIVCTNSRRQQQWGLVLVFLVNFFFAHVLSVCLNQMAYLSKNDNWWIRRGIEMEPWYVKYIWGYYWGINIMLTVGFGDLVASNWQEALCLIFIETISCIIFSYNINCVGNLINNLRLQQVEKEKNLKTFRRMCVLSDPNGKILCDLESRINHFIEKSIEIKHNNDVESEVETLSLLPERLKTEFILKVNTKIIDGIYFFKDLNRKCIEDIAFRLEKRISLPEELVIRRGDRSRLMVLSKGEAAYIAYQQKRGKKEHVALERIASEQDASPKLLSFCSFIKRREQKFDIMSTDYAVLYCLEQQPFYDALRYHKLDYERYCNLRDNEGWEELTEGYDCPTCKSGVHTKFECPRLHYIPLRELVCLKYKNLSSGQSRSYAKRLRRKCSNYTAILHNDAMSLERSAISLKEVSMHYVHVDNVKSNTMEEELKTIVLDVDRIYIWKYYSPSSNMPKCLRGYSR